MTQHTEEKKTPSRLESLPRKTREILDDPSGRFMIHRLEPQTAHWLRGSIAELPGGPTKVFSLEYPSLELAEKAKTLLLEKFPASDLHIVKANSKSKVKFIQVRKVEGDLRTTIDYVETLKTENKAEYAIEDRRTTKIPYATNGGVK